MSSPVSIGGWPSRGSVIHARYTPGAGGIKVQPGRADLFATYEAITVFTLIHATQRAVDFLKLYLPPARRFLCHLLGLQGVNAGQAANPRLVEHHSASCFPAGDIQLLDFILEVFQRLPKRV